MPLTVVLHGMSAPHHLARELRVTLYALADAEESRPRLALIEKIEHPGVIRGIGTIVDRDGDLPPAGRGIAAGASSWVRAERSRRESRGREQRVIRDHGAELPRATRTAVPGRLPARPRAPRARCTPAARAASARELGEEGDRPGHPEILIAPARAPVALRKPAPERPPARPSRRDRAAPAPKRGRARRKPALWSSSRRAARRA